jgi:hypothetical protein
MTEEEAEEMVKALLKRVKEKDQLLHDLECENVRLAASNTKLMEENVRLKAEIERLMEELTAAYPLLIENHRRELLRRAQEATK